MPCLSCGMWDLVPWLGIESRSLALGACILSHWAIREVPEIVILISNHPTFICIYSKTLSQVGSYQSMSYRSTKKKKKKSHQVSSNKEVRSREPEYLLKDYFMKKTKPWWNKLSAFRILLKWMFPWGLCYIKKYILHLEGKKVKVKLLQWCLTLCDPMGCSPAGSSVHRILQTRILKWVALPFSRISKHTHTHTHTHTLTHTQNWITLLDTWNYTTL